MSITAKIGDLNAADLNQLGARVAELRQQIAAALAAREAVESARAEAWETGLDRILDALETNRRRGF